MTDYKALCAELLGALENEGHAHWPGGPDGDPLIEQARAALALPEPEGVPRWSEGICGDGAAILRDGVMIPVQEVIAELNRRPTPQPPASGEVGIDEMCGVLKRLGIKPTEYTDCAILYEVTFDQLRAVYTARAVLARWGCPQPEPETDDSLTNYPKVTRVEVITSKGREFVQHECAHVQFSLQDDGRTIKVFLSSND
jgi:hypothetical protein